MDDSRPPQPGGGASGGRPPGQRPPGQGASGQGASGDEHRPGWQHAASSTRDAARTTAPATARAGQATRRTVRRATNAQGAGESGLAKLTELSGVNAAADALIAVSLAGSLFFSVPIGEARERVALYLIITMVPFALLAPMIGPLLDRLRSGRRYALAVTFGARAFLAWSMAGGVDDADLWLYPAVFGILVGSKAYGVTRAACVPRLLPPSVPLVRANSWNNLAGLLSAAVAAGIGVVIVHLFGAPWALRLAAVVFVVGAVLSVRLPRRIDMSGDERRATLSGDYAPGETGPAPVSATDAGTDAGTGGSGTTGTRGRSYVGPAVEMGLRANMVFRAVSGFVTLFLAFLLRQEPIGSLSDTTAIGLVIGAAGVGSVLGTSVGALTRDRAPEAMLVGLLVVQTAAMLLTAVWWGLPTVLGAGFAVGFAQTLGKLALDAMIQRDVDDDVRTSAFARSETWLQMAWVSGGALGIGLPLRGDVGFGIASGAMLVFTALVVQNVLANRKERRRAGTHGAATPPGPPPVPDRPYLHKPDLHEPDLHEPDPDQPNRDGADPHEPEGPEPDRRPAANQPVPRRGPLHPGSETPGGSEQSGPEPPGPPPFPPTRFPPPPD